MASAASLSEPQVLEHAKRRLFPDDASDAYAVVDTQFGTEEWLPDRPIPADVREQLAPFNHVRLGSGYPDLVGVRLLESDLLAVERFGEDPPLVAVEAKGYTAAGTADVERGVVQAYDRLHEANAAYVAAPTDTSPGPLARWRGNSTSASSPSTIAGLSTRSKCPASSGTERPTRRLRSASRRPQRASPTSPSR